MFKASANLNLMIKAARKAARGLIRDFGEVENLQVTSKALGDFVTPQLVGGTSGFTYGKIIYSNFGMAFNWPFGAALASILLIVSVIV